MIEVIGPWGAGTSLVCAILQDSGCYFGPSVVGRDAAEGRNKHGIYEHHTLHRGHDSGDARKAEGLTISAFADIMVNAEVSGERPACKMPGIILSPVLWHLWFAAATGVVWVERPTKDYTKDKVWAAVVPEEKNDVVFPLYYEMKRQHPCPAQYTLMYEDLYHEPARIIEDMCDAMSLRFDPTSVELVDTSWPDQPPPSASSEPVSNSQRARPRQLDEAGVA